jgi:hypothetical protein
MALLDYVVKINNAIPMLSESYAAHLWATVDGLSFDAEEILQPWSWYNDFYREVMKCSEGFPELEPHERRIICDFVMYPIRERIERAEAKFRCYNEMLEIAREVVSSAVSHDCRLSN